MIMFCGYTRLWDSVCSTKCNFRGEPNRTLLAIAPISSTFCTFLCSETETCHIIGQMTVKERTITHGILFISRPLIYSWVPFVYGSLHAKSIYIICVHKVVTYSTPPPLLPIHPDRLIAQQQQWRHQYTHSTPNKLLFEIGTASLTWHQIPCRQRHHHQ